jgi:chorismate lyase/3-hydroxybenzoate synthase
VREALGASARDRDPIGPIDVVTSDSLALLATSIDGARALSADDLRSGVSEAYVAMSRALTMLNRHPIRFWNFVPDPGERMAPDLDRYMVFNAGRYEGYTRWQNPASLPPCDVGRSLPTASAVGILGDDLAIYCLASDVRGVAVENPRQRPAWQYSARYGPMPPCFSRATITDVNGRRLLLVGGTASIVGEDSRHEGDVGAQLEETLTNLDALIDEATGESHTRTPPSRPIEPVRRLIDLRVYVAHGQDAPGIRAALTARCPRAARVEFAIARVCRPELLVEIEGVAEL